MAYAPTVTMVPGGSPVPYAQLLFTTVASGTTTATVYRNAGGRLYRVRRGLDIAASGGFTLIDDEAPFGETMTYSAEMFNSSGASLGFTDPSTPAILDYEGSIIHNPIDSTRNAQVTILEGTAARLSRPFRGELAYVMGRNNPPWIGRGRSGLTDLPLSVMTTAGGTTGLRAVLGEYDDDQSPVVCFRSSLPLGLPGTLFLAIPEPEYQHLPNDPDGATVWALQGTEASPPIESVGAAPLSYGDLETFYSTYSSMESAKATYRALESSYELTGVV